MPCSLLNVLSQPWGAWSYCSFQSEVGSCLYGLHPELAFWWLTLTIYPPATTWGLSHGCKLRESGATILADMGTWATWSYYLLLSPSSAPPCLVPIILPYHHRCCQAIAELMLGPSSPWSLNAHCRCASPLEFRSMPEAIKVHPCAMGVYGTDLTVDSTVTRGKHSFSNKILNVGYWSSCESKLLLVKFPMSLALSILYAHISVIFSFPLNFKCVLILTIIFS